MYRLAQLSLLLVVLSLITFFIAENRSQAQRLKPNVVAASCTLAPPSLVSWWPGDDPAADLATPVDIRNSNRPDEIFGSPQFVPAKVGTGIKFDGESGYAVPNNGSLNPDTFTIDAWLRIDGLTANSSIIIDKRVQGVGYSFGVTGTTDAAGGGRFFVLVQDGTNTARAITPVVGVDGQFHHLTGIVNRGNDLLYLYMDGGAPRQLVNISGVSSITNSGRFFIGQPSLDATGTTTEAFDGVVDELEFFDRGLFQNEIQAIVDAGSAGKCRPTCHEPPAGIAGWWGGDGDARDISGNGHDGSLQGNSTDESGITANTVTGFAVGKVGQSFSFDGVDDYVQIPDSPGLKPSTVTVDAWVKFNSLDSTPSGAPQGYQYLVFKQNTRSGNFEGYSLQKIRDRNGDDRFAFVVSSASGDTNIAISQTVVSANQWYHVAGSYDGQIIIIYVNGQAELMQAGTPFPLDYGTQPVFLGSSGNPGFDGKLNGLLDEVEIFDRVLGGDEIQTIYDAGLAGKCKNVATPSSSPPNSPIVIQVGDATIRFSDVLDAGVTTEIPIDTSWAGTLPAGYTPTGLAYDIQTTTGLNFDPAPEITICFHVPSISDAAGFHNLRILHDDGGGDGLRDISSGNQGSVNPATRTVCGTAFSLSPFVIAQATSPTAARASVRGRITLPDGTPVAGVEVQLQGTARSALTTTDSNGSYQFTNVEANGFYTVTPLRANYSFSPASLSFSLFADKTDAGFTATPDSSETRNPMDTDLFFVRQHYVDFLDREPDQGGLEYWGAQLSECKGNEACLRTRRIDVSAAFFIEREFQQTGSFVYRLYKASLGRRPTYAEFVPDRSLVVGGSSLESSKQTLAQAWTARAEFKTAYPDSMNSTDFVNKLFDTAGLYGFSTERQSYINQLNAGSTRAQVLSSMIDSDAFKAKEYNSAFVLMQYFGYLRRDPDEAGLQFWLNVLDNREPNNYRGMVCSFITSAEYQKRFSAITSHSNAECGQ